MPGTRRKILEMVTQWLPVCLVLVDYENAFNSTEYAAAVN